MKFAAGKPAATKRVEKLLASKNTSVATIMASTFTRKFDVIDRIEQMIATLEWRRNATLREIDRRRANFAQRMRSAMQKIEDAEFETVEHDASPKTEAADAA